MSEEPHPPKLDPHTPPNSEARPTLPLKASYYDTPLKPPLAASAAFRGQDLEKKRDAIVEHVGPVRICPLEFFFQTIFGATSIPQSVVDDVEAELVEKGTLINGRWKGYQQDPVTMTGHEDSIYSQIAEIHANIMTAAKPLLKTKGLTPTLKLVAKPNNTPIGEIVNATRPDSYSTLTGALLLKSLLAVYRESWFSIPVAWEFKKSEKDCIDNLRKILYNLNHILSNDPRRRFAFGVTIENTQLRVWFACRSFVIVSDAFNFITNASQFIRLVLTLAFSTPQSLGFDESMSQIKDKSGYPQYTMEVNGRTFVTIRPLADYRAVGICGSATRIWLVYDEQNPASRHVLKDMWISRDSITEGDQLRQLHQKLGLVEHHGDRRPSDYFLTVLEDGFVHVTDKNGSHPDDTLGTILGGTDIAEDADVMTTVSLPDQQKSAAGSRANKTLRSHHIGLPSAPKPEPPVSVRLHNYHRKHSRIVFEEFGTTIYDLGSLSAVMCALADATQALKFLHDLGLVHRDVSPGNILVVDGLGKVSDLECLKVYREDQEGAPADICTRVKEHQTATTLYTAVEVEAKTWYFRPTPTDELDIQPQWPVRSNPLHDLESIIWITFWAVTRYRVEDTFSPAQTAIFNACFGPAATTSKRHSVLSMQGLVRPKADQFPTALAGAVVILLKLRQCLHMAFGKFERTLDLNNLDLSTIHKNFIDGYKTAAEQSQNVHFVLDEPSTLIVAFDPAGKAEKRSREMAFAEDSDEEVPVASTSTRVKSGKAVAKKSREATILPSAGASRSSGASVGQVTGRRRSVRLQTATKKLSNSESKK